MEENSVDALEVVAKHTPSSQQMMELVESATLWLALQLWGKKNYPALFKQVLTWIETKLLQKTQISSILP